MCDIFVQHPNPHVRKIISSILRALSLHQAEMEEEEAQFFVVLCHDVFLEVIHWGNRRQLVKLERVGQRFHWNVERFFSKTPFLRLNLCLGPTRSLFIISCYFCYRYLSSSQAGEAKISDDVYMEYSDWTDISLTAVFPPFLRFYPIELIMSWSNRDADKARDKQSIIEKCQFFEDQLKLIKPEILNDSELCFVGIVDEKDSSRFANHSELLKYLSDRILPICDKLRGYEFTIELHSDTSAGNYVLTSLLQMPQINCCSDVRFRICNTDQTKLPVDEISNWLHRKYDGQRERSLRIYMIEVGNLMEMLNHLKEVIVSF